MVSVRHLLLALVVRSALGANVQDPAKFRLSPHWDGLETCVKIVVSEETGEVFCGEKFGRIRWYASMKAASGDFTILWDAGDLVAVFGDKGLLALAVDPDYPSSPYVYAFLSVNRLGDAADDTKPLPAAVLTSEGADTQCPAGDVGASTDGSCDSAARLVRIQVTKGVGTMQQVLAHDWCSNGFSHHIGNIAFASDKSLLLAGGDGSSFTVKDLGTRTSPCYRTEAASAKQGAFRAQLDDFVNGKMLRITQADLHGDRLLTLGNGLQIVAKGLRNPFRWAIHPVTGDVYIGDPGSDFREEINILPNPLKASNIPNFQWPCMEGTLKQPLYGSEEECATLTNAVPPFFEYSRNVAMKFVNADGEKCMTGSVSPSGFGFRSGGAWGNDWENVLFWSDSSQRCLMYFGKDSAGNPDKNKMNLVLSTDKADEVGKWVDILFTGDRKSDMYVIEHQMGGTWKIEALNTAAGPDGSGSDNAAGSDDKSSKTKLWLVIAACIVAVGAIALVARKVLGSKRAYTVAPIMTGDGDLAPGTNDILSPLRHRPSSTKAAARSL